MAFKPVKKDNDTKKDKSSYVNQYLFEADIAREFRDKMIDRSIDRIYKNKFKNLEKGVDPMVITEAWLANNEYIKSRVLECLPTRDVRLDIALAMDMNGNRGLPRGKTIEISGAEETMKSARLYQFYGDIQEDPRGAIIHHYEAESKFQARYVAAGGANPDQIILSQPPFIEAVYADMVENLLDYITQRDKHIYSYLMGKDKGKKGRGTKPLITKSTTNEEFDKLMFLGSLSFPILVFGYDSVGNHESMLKWQKTQDGRTTKTPGAHAAAHAEGFRSVKSLIGNSMALFMYINHTKDVLNIGQGQKSNVKMTDTYGGKHIKYMSDVRIAHSAGSGSGQTSMLSVTRDGVEVIIGKWLTVKFLKNSIVETSKTKVEHCLFSYKYGFNAGVSYLLALDDVGHIKGNVGLTPSKETTIILPNDKKIDITFDDFHKMLMKDASLRNKFRAMITKQANNNAVLVREDV